MEELIAMLRNCIKKNRPILLKPDMALEILNYLGIRP
jgi:hypothetical protein